jgi:hypothetical protein
MIAHSPEMARQAGVPQSVGKEFSTSGSRYKSLPERKGDNVAKKKFLKKDKGEKVLKRKISQKESKTEDQKMASRYRS